MQKMGPKRVSRLALTISEIAILALVVGTPRGSGAWNESDQQGGDGIGHATLVLMDLPRNPDRSTPVTTAGRPLYLHIWYPTSSHPTQKIRYTWNNPVYNQNPGG